MIENILINAWQTLDSVNNSDGVYTMFTYSAGLVPIFIPMMLFAIFLITTIGSYYASKRLSGAGDFPASFAAGGFFTAVVSIFMSLIPGLINLPTIVITFGVSILGIIWLFFSRK